MAVAFVKQATGNSTSSSTSLTCTFGSATTAGNLLVLCMAGDKNTGNMTSAGWTQVHNSPQTSVSLYQFWRVSTGETSFTINWSTSSSAGNTAWIGEYQDTAVTGSSWEVVGSALQTYSETNATSKATGTTGTLTGAGMGIAVAAVDSSQSVTSVSAWGNSYSARHSATGLAGRGAVFVAEKLETSGTTTSSTFTYSGTSDQIHAGIGVFRKTSASTTHSAAADLAATATRTTTGVRTTTTAGSQVVTASRTAAAAFTLAGAATLAVTATATAGAAIAGQLDPFDDLSDDFNAAAPDTSKWWVSSNVTIVGNRLKIVPNTDYGSLWLQQNHRLTDSHVFVELAQTPIIGNGTIEAQFLVSAGDGDATWVWTNGTLTSRYQAGQGNVNMSTETYSATDHRFLRIRETSGTLFWETSPNGLVWTVASSVATPIDTDSAACALRAGYWGTEPDVGFALFDNLNIDSAAPVVPLSVTASPTGAAERTANADGSLPATAALDTSAARTAAVSAALAVTAPLSAAATVTTTTASSLTATATPTAEAAATRAASTDLSVTATLTSAAVRSANATTTLTATATTASTAALTTSAQASLPVTATLTATATVTRAGLNADADTAVTVGLASSADKTSTTQAPLPVAATITAGVAVAAQATASLTVTAAPAAEATVTSGTTAALTVTVTTTAQADLASTATALLAATATLSAAASVVSAGELRDITLTATLGERRYQASLDGTRSTATIGDRRTTAGLGTRKATTTLDSRRFHAELPA